nr:ATP-binding protein [Kineosporia rhizophila]
MPAIAIRDSVREALANVARHASVSEADLSVQHDHGRLVVEIRDRGRGFDPSQVPLHRRGIAESIVSRMHRAGGTGSVTSAPGRGTVVRLEWADA